MAETTTPWQVLTSGLSLGRLNQGGSDKERAADIAVRGEIVHLTEAQVQHFKTAHQVPVIRPASEKDDPLPVVTAKHLFRPAPGPQQFGARPDPAGASRVAVNPADPASHPEANAPEVIDPDAGSEGATARTRARRQ